MVPLTPVSPKTLRDFYENFTSVPVKKGTLLYVQSEIPRYAYAVKSGSVRAYIYTQNMDEKSTSFVVEDELLPIGWLFEKTKTAFFNYVAHTDCVLYRIDRTRFHHLIEATPGMAYVVLRHSINDYMAKVMQINALEQSRADLKLLHLFKYLCLRHGRTILRDHTRITIPLTQKDIASFTGLTRETVTIEMLKLKKAKLITVKSYYYSVDMKCLEEMMDDDPLSNVILS